MRDPYRNRTYYVGDVEANYGHYYRVSSSGVTTLAGEGWDVCPPDSFFLGRHFEVNGFWICMSFE